MLKLSAEIRPGTPIHGFWGGLSQGLLTEAWGAKRALPKPRCTRGPPRIRAGTGPKPLMFEGQCASGPSPKAPGAILPHLRLPGVISPLN